MKTFELFGTYTLEQVKEIVGYELPYELHEETVVVLGGKKYYLMATAFAFRDAFFVSEIKEIGEATHVATPEEDEAAEGEEVAEVKTKTEIAQKIVRDKMTQALARQWKRVGVKTLQKTFSDRAFKCYERVLSSYLEYDFDGDRWLLDGKEFDFKNFYEEAFELSQK